MMQFDDPELFAELYVKIGDLLLGTWKTLLDEYSDVFCVCRNGDDMGFKSQPLLPPYLFRDHVIPQYKRIIKQIHDRKKPFLLHSCGCIFDIMDDLIDAGINAKHSNEDVISDYSKWIDLYSGRIALFGGIDTDRICRMKQDDLFDFVVTKGTEYRNSANGYALGSGNSIPDYVPIERYLAMVKGVQEIRKRETA